MHRAGCRAFAPTWRVRAPLPGMNMRRVYPIDNSRDHKGRTVTQRTPPRRQELRNLSKFVVSSKETGRFSPASGAWYIPLFTSPLNALRRAALNPGSEPLPTRTAPTAISR
jgi:hypothetical protein